MADFNRNKFSRGGGSGGFKRRDFNDRPSRGPVEMHKAICDNCGKECEVPFRPTSGKPIFCSNCFEQKNSGSDSRRDEGRFSGRSESRDWNPRRSSDEREMFEAVCDNCGKNCKIPFRPTGGRPVYCSDCFEKGNNEPQRQEQSNYNRSANISPKNESSSSVSSTQFEALNQKVDRILKILESATTDPEPSTFEEIVDQPVEEQAPVVEKKKRSSKKTA